MNHKPTDPRRTRLLPSLSRLARKMQAHDDARNLSLLKKTAALLYLAILLVNGFHIGTSPDSEGYFTAGAHLFGGNLDFFRTPVFPLICQSARAMCGPYAPYAISLLLFAAFLGSVIVLYRTLSLLSESKGVRTAATALYACNPAVVSWCVEDIGTESLLQPPEKNPEDGKPTAGQDAPETSPGCLARDARAAPRCRTSHAGAGPDAGRSTRCGAARPCSRRRTSGP